MSEERDILQQMLIELKRIAREQTTIRELTSKFVNAMIAAEREIPEDVRRFATYAHDIHDQAYMLEVRGLPVHQHFLKEMERCDDRFRQILERLHTDGGAFEKVRREMAADPLNRWDHTKFLEKPKENGQ